MKRFSMKLLIVMATLIVLDFLWLKLIFRLDHPSPLSPLVRISGGSPDDPLPTSVLLYALMAWSLLYFSWNATRTRRLSRRILHSALFGLGLFAVYECSNYLAFPNADPRILVADVLWGSALFAGSALAIALFEKYESAKDALFSHVKG